MVTSTQAGIQVLQSLEFNMGSIVAVCLIIFGIFIMFKATSESMSPSNLDNHCVGEGLLGLVCTLAGIAVIIMIKKGII